MKTDFGIYLLTGDFGFKVQRRMFEADVYIFTKMGKHKAKEIARETSYVHARRFSFIPSGSNMRVKQKEILYGISSLFTIRTP